MLQMLQLEMHPTQTQPPPTRVALRETPVPGLRSNLQTDGSSQSSSQEDPQHRISFEGDQKEEACEEEWRWKCSRCGRRGFENNGIEDIAEKEDDEEEGSLEVDEGEDEIEIEGEAEEINVEDDMVEDGEEEDEEEEEEEEPSIVEPELKISLVTPTTNQESLLINKKKWRRKRITKNTQFENLCYENRYSFLLTFH